MAKTKKELTEEELQANKEKKQKILRTAVSIGKTILGVAAGAALVMAAMAATGTTNSADSEESGDSEGAPFDTDGCSGNSDE